MRSDSARFIVNGTTTTRGHTAPLLSKGCSLGAAVSSGEGLFNKPGQCPVFERFAEVVGWDSDGQPVLASDLAVCDQPAGHTGTHAAKWSGGIRYWEGE